MTKNAMPPLDENSRRYYLEAMGIQYWELVAGHDDNVIDASDEVDAKPFQAAPSAAQQLEADVRQCARCQLHTARKQALAGRGNLAAELMFVLLAPDASDDQSGLICSGEANTLLTKMLAAINVAIEDVYISSLLKCCVPPQHTITTTELHHCAQFLTQQLELIKPKLLVVIGDTAARCLLQKNSSLDDLRAVVNAQTCADMAVTAANVSHQFASVPVFVSYSPQELMQQPANKRKAWQDLQQIQHIMQLW